MTSERNTFHYILAVAYSILLWFAVPDAAPLVLIALFLLIRFPQKKILIIALTTLVFKIISVGLVYHDSYRWIQPIFNTEIPTYLSLQSWVTGLIDAATLILLISFRKLIVLNVENKNKFSVGVIGILIIYFSSISVVRTHFLNPYVEAILIWMIIALAKYIWFFAYDLQSKTPTIYNSIIERISFYSAFWAFRLGVPTIPKGETFWTQFMITDSKKLLKTRYQAVQLLTWALVLKYISDYFSNWITQASFWNIEKFFTVNQMLRRINRGDEFTFLEVFMSGLADNAINLSKIVIWGHITVSLIWFCGFNVPKNTDNPHLSKNPVDFFSRINFYLKEAVFQLFYFPCFLRLKKWPLRIRIFISLLYAICVGKFLLNYTKVAIFIINKGIIDSLKQHAAYFIYCVLMALLLYPFLVTSIEEKKQRHYTTLQKILFSILIFIGYTAIRMFDTIAMDNPAVNAKLFLLFFGIKI